MTWINIPLGQQISQATRELLRRRTKVPGAYYPPEVESWEVLNEGKREIHHKIITQGSLRYEIEE